MKFPRPTAAILVLVAADPKSEFRADQFVWSNVAAAKSGTPRFWPTVRK